jgi:NADPH:quinone reductase-like Zn-dependent oxidoreductase
MAAITFARYGGPEVLTLTEIEVPEPGPGEVRVRVKAAGVNPFDVKLRRGDLARMFPRQFPVTAGLDAAGVVDSLGEGVSGFAVGDDVLGVAAHGSYAGFALLPAPVRKPGGLSWELAAALPTVGEAAVRALAQLHLSPGESVLIHGAGGSVGGLAAQLALSRGVNVVGSAAEADAARVRGWGAIPVRYGDGLADRVRAAAPQGIDAVLDTAGHGLLPVSIELAGGAGRVITIADMEAAKYGVRFSGGGPGDGSPGALDEVVALAAAGKLDLPIWRSYPLAEAARAHADIEAGTNRGKIVLSV